MLRNIPRAIVSLVWVLLAFGVYMLVFTPWIDRPLEVLAEENGSVPEVRASTSTTRFLRELKPLFPEGSWELQQPTVLRSDQVTILLHDFKELDDGSLQIKPCTLVFFGKEGDASKNSRGPTIMQAPEGAVLQFDEPIDLSNNRIGKPVSGQLVGQIRIFSQGSATSDDLILQTSNVMIDEKRVRTSEQVKFQLGENYGQGRYLMISRAEKTDKRDKSGSWLDDLGMIELEQLERLSLRLAGDDMFSSFTQPGGSNSGSAVLANTPVARTPNGPMSQVEVSCTGPLRFDLRRMIATVEENVAIMRKLPDQAIDTLRADQISLHLTRVPPPRRIDGGAQDKSPRLALTRVVGVGSPLVIDVASRQSYVETMQLEYNFDAADVKLRAYNPYSPNSDRSGVVRVRNADYEIASPAIDYLHGETLAETKLIAAGPGHMRGTLEGNGQQIEASWRTSLSVQPFEGQQVLKLDGVASVTAPGLGQIESEAIELWLVERRVPVATRQDGTIVYKTNVLPRKLVSQSGDGATTNIQSPQFRGTLQRLTVQFQPGIAPLRRDDDAPNPGFLQPTPGVPGGTPIGSNAVAANRAKSTFVVNGGDLLVTVDPDSQQLHGFAIRGETTVIQESAQATPMSLRASSVDFQYDAANRPVARLTGTPAELSMSNMVLRGDDISLLGDQNRVLVPGRGSMRLPMTSPTGSGLQQAPAIEMIDVEWSGGLDFDGQLVTLSGDVVANGRDLTMRTDDDLVILLDDRIDMSRADSGNVRPEVARVSARGGLFAANRGRDERGKPSSYQQIFTRDGDIDLKSGEMVANGPGWIAVTTIGSALSGITGQDTASTGNELTQMSLVFRNRLVGHLHRRDAKIDGDIRGWFGVVDAWEKRINPVEQRDLGEKDFRFACEEIFVMESPTAPIPNKPRARKPLELLATGDTYVESQGFAASGSRIKYAEDKGMLTLEGDQDRLARLWQRSRVGAPVSQTGMLQRIRFWPRTGDLDVVGSPGADLSAGRSRDAR